MSKRTEKLRKKIAAGELVSWAWIDMASPMGAEIMVDAGFDWILVDAEHNPFNPETLLHILLAFRGADTVPVIRVAWNDQVMIKQALDLGFEGIVTPQTSTAEDARRAVAACRYPPAGRRGFGPMRPGGYFRDGGEYVRRANKSIICGIQIENICGADEIEKIVKIPGLDWILIGRYDMAGSMNMPWDVDSPGLWKAVRKIAEAARKAGIAFGVPLGGPDDIKRTVKAGGQLISVGRDSMYLQSAADHAVKAFQEFAGGRRKK